MTDACGHQDTENRDQTPAVTTVQLNDCGKGQSKGDVLEEVGLNAGSEVHGVDVVVGSRGGLGRSLAWLGDGVVLVVADESAGRLTSANDADGEEGVHDAKGKGEGGSNS